MLFRSSVFQITKSAKHGGSNLNGYQAIRKIMTHVCAFLEDLSSHKQKAKVTVEYVLVCPSPVEKRSWQMPEGWNMYTTQQDHRGKAYCLHLPV